MLQAHADHELADEAATLLAESFYTGGRYDRVDRAAQFVSEQRPESPLRERAELFLGLAQMARGEYVAASEQFTSMTERFPEGAYADQSALLLAQCLHRSDALQAAIEWYRQVIQRARAAYLPDALYGLAVILHQQDQPQGAGRLLDRLLDEFPDYPLAADAILLRGRAFFDQEEYERALSTLQPLTASDDRERADAVYWAAKSRLRLGDADGAADRLGGAIERYPDSDLLPEMTFDRAVALLRAEQPEDALTVLRRFTKQYGDHALAGDALHMSAATQHQLGLYDQSLATCRTYQQRFADGPHAAAITFLVGENAFLLDDDATAVESFRSYLRAAPDAPQRADATYRLGMALHRQGQFEEAEATLLQIADATETTASFRPALLVLGDHAFQRADWATAAERLERYLAFGMDQSSSDDALLKLGLARQRMGNDEDALSAYADLLETFPDSPRRRQAMFERGQVLAARGDTAEATAAFTGILEADGASPYDVHALNHLGVIAAANGEHERAADFFGRVADAENASAPADQARFRQGQALMSAKRFDQAAENSLPLRWAPVDRRRR